MLGLLALCAVLILIVVMLPVINGIGSYKKKVLQDYEPRVKVIKKKKDQYQPYGYSYGDDGQVESVASSGASIQFAPSNVAKPRSRHIPSGPVDPHKPQNSHIDNDFDYDSFIKEQDQEDRAQATSNYGTESA